MPPKIIIKEATREQTFELHQPSTVLGREPGCDIQLLDAKLSRRHARLEVSPQGVKLTDLGSTNGTFVNGRQISDVWLQHGDAVQIGNIRISFLNEVMPEIATPVVSSIPPPPPSSSPAPFSVPQPAMPTVPEESPELKTSFLDAQRLQELSKAPPPPQEELTYRLPSLQEAPATSFFDVQKMQQMSQQPVTPPSHSVERMTQGLGPSAMSDAGGTTFMLSGGTEIPAMKAPSQPADESLLVQMQQVQHQVVSKIHFPTMAWRTKFILMLTLVLIFLIVVITVPLLIAQEKAMVRISLDRGHALVRALAARNRYGVVNNQQLQLEGDYVKKEEGVKDSMILDAQGRVLSPAARSGDVITRIEGIDKGPTQIRIPEEGVTSSGDYNLVLPIKNDNEQTVGLAWVTYTPAGLSDSASTIAVVIMLVIFLALIGGVSLVWSATNMTVKPLIALQEATEMVIRGSAQSVENLIGFAEVNVLAHSINRLIEHSASMPMAAAPAMAAAPHPSASPIAAPQPGRGSTAMGRTFGGSEAGDLVVDGNFTVVDVKGNAIKWLGMRLDELIGKHVIEAVREQSLLEVILDLINALATQPQAKQEVDFSSVASLGGLFILEATKMAGTDHTRLHLVKK